MLSDYTAVPQTHNMPSGEAEALKCLCFDSMRWPVPHCLHTQLNCWWLSVRGHRLAWQDHLISVCACTELQWCEGHEWTANIALPPGTYEFKCIVVNNEGQVQEWEGGHNRSLEVWAAVKSSSLAAGRGCLGVS